MHERPLPNDLANRIFAELKITSLYDGFDVDAHHILETYNSRKVNVEYKLSVVQFGEQFVCVLFNATKSCWYNPDNRFGCQDTYYRAVLDGVGTSLNLICDYCYHLATQDLRLARGESK